MISSKIQLRWNDIDMLGHLYNGQYQHLFDVGKSDFFEQVLHFDHRWVFTNKGLLTAQTLNNYYEPTEINEPVVVETSVERVGNKSFTLFQQLKNSDTGVVKADSRSVLVCYDPSLKSSVVIFADWLPTLHSNIG